MKYQNTLGSGIIDLDNDERYVEPDKLLDAENFTVTTTQGSSRGVGKPVLGNLQKSTYDYLVSKSIGCKANPSEEKVYNFIKAFDYDYIIEYDTIAEESIIVAQTTTGGALNFIEGEKILNINIIIDPEGNGNLLKWSGDSNPPRIGNIERMKTWGIDGFTAEEIMLIKPPPTYPPILNPVVSINNAETNYLESKFVSFCCRWKYKDGYYSAVSSWSRYFFTAGNFELDFESFQNLGMQNIYNAVNLTFNTGDREVEAIDLCFKLSNSTSIYVIDKFVKNDEGWIDNSLQTILFDNSKVYTILPESEYYRSFDNVPHTIIASDIAGNRGMDSNFTEQYDLIDKNGDKVIMDYTLSLVTNTITNTVLTVNKEDVTYSFESPDSDVIVTDGQINIDFTDIEFVDGAFIFINFYLQSTNQEIIFNNPFNYVIDGDYTDLTNFFDNSTFVDTLTTEFTAYFENNGGVTLPDMAIGYTLLQGFLPTLTDPNTLSIRFPVVKYEIDNDPDPNTFVYDYFYDVLTQVNFQNVGVNTSMKSRRTYEICMIYRDLQVRKTTALTSTGNTIFIENENCINQNIINVNIPITQKPPVWAKTYKFGVKVKEGIYQQIMASIFFVDGTYRWIKLDGENKGKVKEGDTLIVKKDSRGAILGVIKVKVLELKSQEADFIDGNSSEDDVLIKEPAGLYMKIQPENFDMSYAPNEFQTYIGAQGAQDSLAKIAYGGLLRPDSSDVLQPIPLKQGSIINLKFHGNVTLYDFEKTYVVQDDYPSFEDWMNAEVSNPIVDPVTGKTFTYSFATFSDENRYLVIEMSIPFDLPTKSSLTIRSIDGYFIFETEPVEIDLGIFYETPEIYNVIDGEHEFVDHLLTETFNCYCFGNGAESYQILDSMTQKYLSIDFCPTAVNIDGYRRLTRYADITYSGVYNANTNVNKLNEYNLFLANYKDDIEKRFGAVWKIVAKDTDLEIYQEDRVSRVYYGKDLLYNTDGTTNLTAVPQVLGQQDPYVGEYGISQFPDSFDSYAIDSYWADPKRGVILKKSNNGIFEISSQGMKSYFKNLFRNNTINDIIGRYDQFLNMYIMNIKYNGDQYITWLYSDEFNGWTCRQTFSPETMTRINNQFYSFKNGEIFLHNQEGVLGDNYNKFYNESFPSTFSIIFSQEPSVRKNYKTVEIEGNVALDMILTTDYDNGYINNSDFELQEGVIRAYCRISNGIIDTSLLSFQGIGNASINGLVLTFTEVPSIVSVGDVIYNANMELVGTILDKTDTTLTLDIVSNLSEGDFVACSKSQSVNNDSLLGYYMKAEAQFQTNSIAEIYALNTNTNKSYS